MEYIGNELDDFKLANNWKRYFASIIRPYLKGSIIEVGAGIGATTKLLCDGSQKEWVCLEPDHNFIKILKQEYKNNRIPKCCKIIKGEIKNIPKTKAFDVILYIDVIEHIENDKEELLNALKFLNYGGYLIILSPAHNKLYSQFDKSIGHFRRYNKKLLTSIIPKSLILKKIIYLDAVGMLLSYGNKIFLKQSNPNKKQILFWDKCIIPLTKIFDKLLFYSVGKSILGIWQKN